MADFSRALEVSVSAMRAQTQRLTHVSENIANADTPGYRRKTVSFESYLPSSQNSGQVKMGRVSLDQSDLSRVYDPSHPLADDTGNYLGSNVNMVLEIADAREAQRSYEANLRMFDQARQMSSGLMDLIRRR